MVARVTGPLQVVSAEVAAAGRDALQKVLIAPVHGVTRTVSDWKAAQANQNASWWGSARSRRPTSGPPTARAERVHRSRGRAVAPAGRMAGTSCPARHLEVKDPVMPTSRPSRTSSPSSGEALLGAHSTTSR